jgi:hypothetical protein
MNKTCASLLLGLIGAFGAGSALAHGPAWSVTLGPGGFAGFSVGLPVPVYAPIHVAPRVVHAPPVYAAPVYAPPVYAPPVYAPPVYAAPVTYGPAPVYHGGYGHGYHRPHIHPGYHGHHGHHRPHGYWHRY